MAALALADLLQDFGSPARMRSAPAPLAPQPEPQPHTHAQMEMFDQAQVDAAVIEAETRLRDELEAAHKARLDALIEGHKGEIDSLRTELGEQSGRRISERLDQMEATLNDLLTAAVARILGIHLSDGVKDAAIAELARAITAAIGDREALRIRVTGPQLLFESLRPALGRHAETVEFSEAPGFDLTVTIDSAVFETRIGDWSHAMAEILG